MWMNALSLQVLFVIVRLLETYLLVFLLLTIQKKKYFYFCNGSFIIDC